MSKFGNVNTNTHTCTQNVEFSVVKEATFSAGSPQTTLGRVSIKLDLTALVSGDTLEIRRYFGVNGGTVTPVLPNPRVIMAACMDEDEFIGGNAWDYTLKITSATSRALKYEVLQDVGDVNVTSMAANVVTAAAIATDAIDADAIKTDAVTEIQSGLATSTSLTTAQTDLTTITGRLTSGRATNLDNLDAAISTRAPSATAVSTAVLTPTRQALLDNLDAAVSTRASGATALSTSQWTNALATALGTNVDATVSSRAPSSTALSTAIWTNTLAGLVNNLDAAITSRASVTALSAVSTLVVAIGSAVADVQSRLPATLDAGNIKASIQSIASGTLTSVVSAIFGFIMDAGATVGSRTFAEQWRIRHGILAGNASGLTPPTAATTETFNSADDSKPVATFVVATDGTRTVGTLDGTP